MQKHQFSVGGGWGEYKVWVLQGGWKILGLGAGYQFGELPLLGDQYLITCNVHFIYLLTLFIVQNLNKILTADPELWQCASFVANMDHFPQTIFFWKIITILIYLSAPFIVQNLKKLPADPEFWGCAIFGPKMIHFSRW